MKRRNFLSLLGAAGAAPLMPVPVSAAPAAATYNRYMYGLAVFHARTQASVSAVDLASKLRVSPKIARALVREMQAKGVVSPALKAAGGVMRAVSPNPMAANASARKIDAVARRFLMSDESTEQREPDPCQVSSDPAKRGCASEHREDTLKLPSLPSRKRLNEA